MAWSDICNKHDVLLGGGRCALVKGHQVAIFRLTKHGEEKIFAVDNFDPFSKANVLSRGIAGCLNGADIIASPIYKQHFDLTTGQCLEDESVSIKTWPVRLEGDRIQINC